MEKNYFFVLDWILLISNLLLCLSCHLSSEEASWAWSQQAAQHPPGHGWLVAPAGQQEHRSTVPQQVVRTSGFEILLSKWYVLIFDRQSIKPHSPFSESTLRKSTTRYWCTWQRKWTTSTARFSAPSWPTARVTRWLFTSYSTRKWRDSLKNTGWGHHLFHFPDSQSGNTSCLLYNTDAI